MNFILDKTKVNKIVESFKVSTNSIVFIHHPITEDVIRVNVKKIYRDSILVSILEDSPYYGQPDFQIPKYSVLGIV